MVDYKTIKIPTFQPPGIYNGGNMAYQMIDLGRRIRDEYAGQYPLLPGVLYIFQQMASQREIRVSGKPRSVARAIEGLNNAQTLLYDGTVDYGFEQFQKRRSMDYNCIGRTIFYWGDGKLRYLDPATVFYDQNQRKWVDSITQELYDPEFMVVNHPIPLGSSGSFVSPSAYVIPTAMLAWLIREHDRAAADGRKIRDIMIVGSEELATAFKDAVEETLALWNGKDPKNGVPIVHVDIRGMNGTSTTGFKVADMVARFGLANIPDNFDREQFQFQYVNELAAAYGISLRHFWNSEKATNRALEEVQEARQAWKGPAAYVRSEQRLLNASGYIERTYGAGTRFSFIEEVDIASQEVEAKVLKTYAEAAQIFYETGIILDDKALIAWLQSRGILPADLEIMKRKKITNPEEQPTPRKDRGETFESSDAPITSVKAVEFETQPEEHIDYDEITMDINGRIIERRLRVFSFEMAIESELLQMKAELEVDNSEKVLKFSDILDKARKENLAKFKSIMLGLEAGEELEDIMLRIDNPTEDDHRAIQRILSETELRKATQTETSPQVM